MMPGVAVNTGGVVNLAIAGRAHIAGFTPPGPALATTGPVTAISTAVTASLPLLLLDVDGVLNPFAAPACPPGYTEHEFFPGEDPVRLCAAHGPWLRELATRFQIVWATAWGADANRLLAPLLQLPDLPVIRFPPVPFHPGDKLPAVARFAGRRPLTWIDDALSAEAHAWAARRRTPTLLIGIDPAEGLTRPVIEQSLHWADDHRAK
jgi:hypothetical protein